MTDTSEQLLPCPFCGDVATIDDNADYHRSNPPPVWLVGCEACNGHDGEHCRSVWMTETTKEKAIEVWNTRHSSLPPDVVAFRAGWRAAVNGLGYEGCEETEDAFPIELDEWLDTTAALRAPRQLDAEVVARVRGAMLQQPYIERERNEPAYWLIEVRLSDVKAMLAALSAMEVKS